MVAVRGRIEVRVKSQQDAAAGIVFAAIGLFGLVVGRDLTIGTASFMEAGYLPRLVSFLLIGVGIVVALRSLMREGPALERWAWRPLAVLTATVAAFGALILNAGLVITSAVVFILSSFASNPLPPKQLAFLAVVVVAISVGLFHFALELPIPLWPD